MSSNAFLFAALVSLGQPAAPPALLSPAQAFRIAHEDIDWIPPWQRQHVRYLGLWNLPEKEREKFLPVLKGHCNQLSRSSLIVPPALVKGALLRVDLRDYVWSADVWEKLDDPYTSLTVEVKEWRPWAGGTWAEDGRYYPPGAFQVVVSSRKEKAFAPWLIEHDRDKERLAELVRWTNSRAPVVRADWFFNQTAAQVDRNPGYYDFLDIKDKASFQKLGGFERKLFEDFRLPLRDAVGVSGVTLQPRAIAGFDSAGGGYWFTVDFKLARGAKNPLKTLGKDIESGGDAFEEFILLPDGFWATGLFNKAGKRQDFAPPEIASDRLSKSNDARVHVNVSCTRCHANGGLQDIDAWARSLFTPPLKLDVFDYSDAAAYKKAFELKAQYLRELQPALKRSRDVYEAAVKEATGLDSKEYAKRYAAFWERYEDAKVTAGHAAADLGMTETELRARLLAYLKAGGDLDPVISAFVHAGARAQRIGIRQYEEALPALYQATRGLVPLPRKDGVK